MDYSELLKNNNIDQIIELYSNNRICLDKLFTFSCESENINVIKWIHSIENNNVIPKFSTFYFICSNGNYNLAKFIYESFDNSLLKVKLDDFFKISCFKGHLILAQWIMSIHMIDKHNIDHIFILTCEHGQLEIIQWLIQYCNVIKITYKTFNKICEYGHLPVAKWLYENEYYKNPTQDIYNIACEYGHLELVIWLTSISNNTRILDSTFNKLCKKGHYIMAKYLIETKSGLKICRNDIISSVVSGNSELVLLLLNTNTELYNIDYNYLFETACNSDSFDMAKWLLTVFPNINVSNDNETSFIYACKNNNIQMAKWLLEIQPNINILVNTNIDDDYINILSYISLDNFREDYIDISNWLISLDKSNKLFIDAFCTLCTYDTLTYIKFMLTLDYKMSVEEYTKAFQIACKKYSSNIAEYLYQIQPNINIGIDNNIIFKKSLKKSKIEICQYIYSIHPNIIKEVDLPELFEYCLQPENLSRHDTEQIEWLHSIDNSIIDKIDIMKSINQLCSYEYFGVVECIYSMKQDIIFETNTFQICCMNNYLYGAKWIYEKQPSINISANNDYALRIVCENVYIELAQWLCSINSNYSIDYNEHENIINYSIERTINIDTSTVIIDNIDVIVCPICYTNNVEYQLNCKHNFCSNCLNKHYTQKTNCPLCRKEIIKCFPIITSFL